MDEAPLQNSVKMTNDGYVLVKLAGPQDYMSMEKVGKDCKRLADELHAQHQPVLGLVDFTKDQGFSTGTNKAVLQALEGIDYDKAALFGNPKLHMVTKAVIAALGKSTTTKLFDTREEALAWLLMKDPLAG
jgi:hypothetical protein